MARSNYYSCPAAAALSLARLPRSNCYSSGPAALPRLLYLLLRCPAATAISFFQLLCPLPSCLEASVMAAYRGHEVPSVDSRTPEVTLLSKLKPEYMYLPNLAEFRLRCFFPCLAVFLDTVVASYGVIGAERRRHQAHRPADRSTTEFTDIYGALMGAEPWQSGRRYQYVCTIKSSVALISTEYQSELELHAGSRPSGRIHSNS